jgi:predicted nucleotidyltransferase
MATVRNKQELVEQLRRHEEDLRRDVQRIGLSGSFQRDEPSSESDVDLLVEFAPGEKSFDHFMAVS